MNPHLQAWQINPDEFPTDGYASDQLEFLLSYAILAPSNHNSQPWLFQIHSMHVDLHADRRRAVRAVDPYDRELTISCGSALYNLRLAAEYFGHRFHYELFPDPTDPNVLARFHIDLRGETSCEDIPLFQAITRRHTHRGPFRPDPVPPELKEFLREAAAKEGAWLHFVEGEANHVAVAELVAEADRVQWASKPFREELAAWVRTQPQTHRDGILLPEIGMKEWMAFAAPTIIRTFDRGTGTAARDREIAAGSPALAVLGTPGDDATSWLAAGQALQAVLLRATSEGLSASFLNQPIETAELRPMITEMTGLGGAPQILMRLGYGLTEPPPSPRRGVREMLIMHHH